MEQSQKLLESCFNVVPSDHPPPNKSLLSLKPHPPLVASGLWVAVTRFIPPPKSLTHFSTTVCLTQTLPPLRPTLALTQAYCSLSAARPEQWLLIGGLDWEGSLGSIYRDSLIYQNNNNPPPKREKERDREANWLLVSHLRGNVHFYHTLCSDE